MYITTMEKIKERNFIIQELMGILKDRMVFANDLSLEVPNDIDDLPGIDILDVGEKYHWHKRKVLDKLEKQAEKEGANALIGIKFWLKEIDKKYLVVYGTAAYAKIEKINN